MGQAALTRMENEGADGNWWIFAAEYRQGMRSPQPPQDDGSRDGDRSTATSSGS